MADNNTEASKVKPVFSGPTWERAEKVTSDRESLNQERMLTQVITSGLLGVVIYYGLWYRDWLNWSQTDVFRVAPGPCQVVIEEGGAEDVVSIGRGIFILSAGFNWDFAPGSLKAVNANGNTARAMTLNITNAPARADFLSSPHGIATWTDPDTGKILLYVLTHCPSKDVIEVFEVDQSPLSLRHLRSITDPLFKYMNDLAVVGRDQFYITLYFPYRDPSALKLQHMIYAKTGKIYFYDGRRARDTGGSYYLPNGINVSKDKKTLYMACWGEKTLYAFRVDDAMGLTLLWKQYMPTGIDNINVDGAGDLWIGSHPITWKILDFFGLFGIISPSQVLRVKLRDNAIFETEQIYLDNGNEIQSSTAAAFADGKMVVTSVYKETVVCKILLYVLTHCPSKDVIEVFEVDQSPLSLRHLRSITDPLFKYMNDLAVVGRDQFYITLYFPYRDPSALKLQHMIYAKTGKIYFYDGRRARDTGGSYYLPNGINVSKDKKTLYMACWGEKTLYAFRVDDAMGLTLLWKQYMPTGIDNINVDGAGDLWIGSHPITWKILDFFGLFGIISPSQVLRVKLRDNAIFETEQIYLDNGNEIQSSTAAAFADGKMVVTSVYKETVVCDVNYLSS